MEKFFDRELFRSLTRASWPRRPRRLNPLLERLKFIGIVSGNMDEFTMVRVASLKAEEAEHAAVQQKARQLLGTAQEYFLKTMVPELAAAGFVRLQPESCNPAQLEFLSQFL